MPTDSLDAEVRSLMPPTEFSRYRETAAKDGWQRLRTWFQQNRAA